MNNENNNNINNEYEEQRKIDELKRNKKAEVVKASVVGLSIMFFIHYALMFFGIFVVVFAIVSASGGTKMSFFEALLRMLLPFVLLGVAIICIISFYKLYKRNKNQKYERIINESKKEDVIPVDNNDIDSNVCVNCNYHFDKNTSKCPNCNYINNIYYDCPNCHTSNIVNSTKCLKCELPFEKRKIRNKIHEKQTIKTVWLMTSVFMSTIFIIVVVSEMLNQKNQNTQTIIVSVLISIAFIFLIIHYILELIKIDKTIKYLDKNL